MKIGAIVILYNPNQESINHAISILRPQTDIICLIDNSLSSHEHWFSNQPNLHYIPLHQNVGIAAAQNIGIDYLMKNDYDYDYALLSDQDSVAEKDTVDKLMESLTALEKNNYRVAAVGTTPFNKKTNKPYPQKSKVIKHIQGKEIGLGSHLTECYSMISSMSLIPIRNFRLIGLFDESLFIDGVDHEWCWRAWHKAKLRSFLVDEAYLHHQLGEGDKKIGSRDISIASPFRVYYQFRNYLWLCRRDYTPKYWKKRHLLKYAVKIFYFPICVAPRMEYAKNIFKGIADGLFKYDKTTLPVI